MRSPADGAVFASPYMVSNLKLAMPLGGNGMNGARRHQPPGTKRANSTSAVGHRGGRTSKAASAAAVALTTAAA